MATRKHTEELYSLNTLIHSLRDCGWDEQADKLAAVRDEVWADPEDSTLDHIYTELTYLPLVGLIED